MRGAKLLLTTGASLGIVASAIAIGTAVPLSGPARPEVLGEPAREAAATPADRQQAASAYAKLPVSFVENQGQTDERVRYYAQGNGYAFYMTPTEVMLSFSKQRDATAKQQTPEEIALALRFVDHNPHVEPRGSEPAAGVINDLRGSDPSQWHTQIPQYRDVVYPNLWPDIDLRLREQSGVLKYEFHVRPGASPADIQLAYGGANGLTVSEAGGLQISTGLGVLQDSAPLSYQDIAGVRVPVTSRYVLGDGANEDGRFSFDVGGYQRNHELIIDPGVQYTTFLGGNSAETGAGIAVDAAGNAYVAGTTQSPNFPTTSGAFDRTGAASNFSDVFVSKLNPAGTALVYSTFVGGSDMEFGRRIAIDAAGNAYVTGQTKSSNFPTTGGAFDRTLNIPANCPRCATDNTDSFVFKLNAAGSAFTYSTYLGGTDYDSARGIAVDGSGNAYVTGETLSSDFPTTAGAFSRTLRGQYDVFTTKLNTTGSALTYSTFLGGTAVDNGERLAVDGGGNVYVLGFSSSTDFPTTPGAFDTTANGGFDATLTKLNPAGSALVYSTYLGGSDFDSGSGLTVDGAGSAYVTGGTPSANFPTTPGAYDTTFNNGDGFVTKFNAAGSALVYSTFIGGSAFDSVSSVVVDPAGNAWLSGGTGSADFPVTAGAPDTTFNGAGDVIIAELDTSGSALLFSTFLGGSESEGGNDIARDPTGDVYITGLTYSQNFPATAGAFDRVWNGDLSIFWGDAFVTKIDIHSNTSTPP
nr:SBBP repeat-containing protein [Actinomycetota bacterium]